MAEDLEETNGTLDFDQFWGEYTQTPEGATEERVKILGEYYSLTVDVPMSLLVRSMTTDSGDVQGMSEIVDEMYGEGTLATWMEKGLSLKQLPIICAWSIARIQGRDMSFAEVAAQLKDFLGGDGKTSSDATGLPSNRVSRRAMEKGLKKSRK